MKCIIALLLMFVVYCNAANFKNTTIAKSPKNETAMLTERKNRESRRYIAHDFRGFNHFDEYDSYKPRPNRFKGRRKPNLRTTTPRYHFEDFTDSYSPNYSPENIFNQDDINDFYLKGNHDYSKLVKSVLKQNENNQRNKNKFFVGNTDPQFSFGDDDSYEPSYKTIATYDKKDSTKINPPVSTTSWGNLKNFDSLKSSFDDYKNNNWNIASSTPSSVGLYGQQFDYNKGFDSGKYYEFGKESSYGSTASPLKTPSESFPLKSYASSFNFDTKPFADIEPTKISIPAYSFGKNNDYVSEFDLKGNPVSPSSNFAGPADLFASLNKEMYSMNKDYATDMTKSFYELNTKKPDVGTNSYLNYNLKQPSETSYGSNYDFNQGYASYNYAPFYGGQNYGGSDFSLKNYNKYGSTVQNDHYLASGSGTSASHPIIVPVPQPYPVKVPIAKPVAVPILKEIKVPVEKIVPYPVVKNVPYPVEKRIPVPVEKQVPVPVPQPFPVKIPIIKNVYHHAGDDAFDHDHYHGDEEVDFKYPRHRLRDEEFDFSHHRHRFHDDENVFNRHRNRFRDGESHRKPQHHRILDDDNPPKRPRFRGRSHGREKHRN